MDTPAPIDAPQLEAALYRLYRDYFDRAEKKRRYHDHTSVKDGTPAWMRQPQVEGRDRKSQRVEDKCRLAKVKFAKKCGWKRNERDKQQEQQISPDQSKIEMRDESKNAVMLDPHHADDKKAVDKPEKLWQQFEQVMTQQRFRKMLAVDDWNL